MTVPTRADQRAAGEKPVSRRALREQREREDSLVDDPSAQDGLLGLGSGYTAVIDEVAPMPSRRAARDRERSGEVDVPSAQPLPARRSEISGLGIAPQLVEAESRRSRQVAAAPRRRSSYVDTGEIASPTAALFADAAQDLSPEPVRAERPADAPSRRRDRSERERRFAWERRENTASAEGSQGLTAAGPRSQASRRSIAKRAFAGTAMVFALGIAVATTVPANAYFALSGSEVRSTVVADASSSAQRLTTGTGAPGDVVRDGYQSFSSAMTSAAGIKTALTYVNNPRSPIQWPFPVGVPISDGFGFRASPGGIGSTDHKGVDFAPGGGTPIGAIADGVVSVTNLSDNNGLGVYVSIEHVIDGQRITSVYGHMKVGSVQVQPGQTVKVGQTLGLVGNTGTSTGNHLHLEVHVDGTPVDPFAWLKQHVKL